MNEAEKKAIEIYKQAIEDINKDNSIYITIEEFKVYTPVLINLIEKQQKELDKKEWLYQRALSDVTLSNEELKKKDKMIEEVTKLLGDLQLSKDVEGYEIMNANDWKQYFEKEIKNE